MLVKVMPEQVADGWGVLEKVIENSLPPIADRGEKKMNNILTSILTRKMICWASYQDPEHIDIDTIILTSVIMDEFSGTKSFLIYSVNALKIMSAEVYEGIIDTLTKYAESMKCDKVVGYIADLKLVELVEKYGGDCSYQLMTFDLKE